MSAAGRSAVRVPQDSYQTPLWCVNSLFKYIEWDRVSTFMEPCRGDGNVYDAAPVQDKRYAEIREGIDYLITPFEPVDLIITNPPYSRAQEFLEKSLSEAPTVVYLLRLNFLEAQRRHDWWSTVAPLDHLLTLSKRPSFTGNGTDATGYAWFCWDRGGVIRPGTRRFEFLK